MTAIQLIESLALNTEHKIAMLDSNVIDNPLAQRAEEEVADLLDKQGKYWCALFPEKQDEEQEEGDAPDNDDGEEKTSEN